jgi:hypothetical protein
VNTDERAKQLLLAHPNIITAVESTISGVVQTAANKTTMDRAHELLSRIPTKIRLSCAEQRAEDNLRLLQAARDVIKEPRKTIESQATKIAALEEKNAELENPDPEHLELVKSAAVIDRKAAVKVKLEPGIKSEPQSKKPRHGEKN